MRCARFQVYRVPQRRPLQKWLPTLIISVFALAICSPLAHGDPIEPTLTVRIDTTKADIKAVLQLVTGYLNSQPDSSYDNPFWSEAENKMYAEPYCARTIVFLNSSISRAFPPRILSIEKDLDCYSCRVLYYAENLEPQYAGSNPWAIQRLYACRENDQWKLFDPIRIVSASWPHTKIGKVDFIYRPDHVFDSALATATGRLVDSLANALQIPVDFDIHFYITDNVDQLSELMGLDFTLNVSAGRAMAPNHIVMSAMGTEWYPHEMVHTVINSNRAHFLVSEGIATLVGGTGEKTFPELVKELNVFLARNHTLTFQQMLDQPYMERSLTYYYAAGAVLCKAALESGGTTALKKLLFAGATEDDLYRALQKVFGKNRDEMTGFLTEEAKRYERE